MSYEDNNPFGEDEDDSSYRSHTPTSATISTERNESAAFLSHENHISVFPMPTRVSSSLTGRCERLDQIPKYLENGGPIYILDAGKNIEGSGGPYISYTIRTGDLEVRRRYSEFESLRASLARLYPCAIVPPIPAKQSIVDYTAGAAKAREDTSTIEHRKRMLEQFLRRMSVHRTLRLEKVFHKFLDPNVSWVRTARNVILCSNKANLDRVKYLFLHRYRCFLRIYSKLHPTIQRVLTMMRHISICLSQLIRQRRPRQPLIPFQSVCLTLRRHQKNSRLYSPRHWRRQIVGS